MSEGVAGFEATKNRLKINTISQASVSQSQGSSTHVYLHRCNTGSGSTSGASKTGENSTPHYLQSTHCYNISNSFHTLTAERVGKRTTEFFDRVHSPRTKTVVLHNHACKPSDAALIEQTNSKTSPQSLQWKSVHIVQPKHLLLCKGWGAPPSNLLLRGTCKLIRTQIHTRLFAFPDKFCQKIHCWGEWASAVRQTIWTAGFETNIGISTSDAECFYGVDQ